MTRRGRSFDHGSESGYRCRWVRHRLPLLAGGELDGGRPPQGRAAPDRLPGLPPPRALAGRRPGRAPGRRVARPGVAGRGPRPRRSGPPWPGRSASRGTSPGRRSGSTSSPGCSARSARLRPALVLAGSLAFAALTAAGVESGCLAGRRGDRPDRRRLPAGRLLRGLRPGAARRVPIAAPRPRTARPRPARSSPARTPPAPAPVVERTAARFDYDLDHGTPMGPDALDVKASY